MVKAAAPGAAARANPRGSTEGFRMFVTHRVRRIGCGLVMMGMVLIAAPAFAQTPEAKDPNPGALTLTGSFDFLTQYMFRGIRQNSTGIAMWPAVDLGIATYSG